MRQIYKPESALFPRLSTDSCFADYDNTASFKGAVDDAFNFVFEQQLYREDLWRLFTEQFSFDSDENSGWRGEYWGKMMRGACLSYSYGKDRKLYRILSESVKEMISLQEESGRISTYGVYHEFDAWDMWCRKYVLLGMEYFLEICEDKEFREEIISCLSRQADYIISKIGKEEDDKKPITKATRNYRGLNSCSVLEPFVRLYSLTKNKNYLEFASYIVSCGGTEAGNIFDMAYENVLYPYEYPMVKAYEMISNFEGLLEYYRVTGIEKYKQAVVCFADKVLESDFTIIGSSGCTHEFFDHSTVRQANTNNHLKGQETCVTVTLMKFMYQLTLLTGDSKYADAFEISYYNAYLGAFNTENIVDSDIKKECPDIAFEALPFDSYSPLTAKRRGVGAGGFQIMKGGHYYGCCACIASAGAGLFLKEALLSTEDGFLYNLYSEGEIETKTPSGSDIKFICRTMYPADGKVNIVIKLKKRERFTVKFRIPKWSRTSKIALNNETPVNVCFGYYEITREWNDNDRVTLDFDMTVRVIRPVPYGKQIIREMKWEDDITVPLSDTEDPLAKHHIALMRGPVVLTESERLGYDIDVPADISVNEDETVDIKIHEEKTAPFKNLFECGIPLTNGEYITVTDYASSGKLLSEDDRIAAWMLIK